MKDKILLNIENPAILEKLYRTNKADFKSEFSEIYPQLKDNRVAKFWYERLNYESNDISWGSRNELVFVIVAATIAGLLAKLPAILAIDKEFFYPRNISFIVFPFLIAFFVWRNKLSFLKTGIITVITIVCLAYINFLPDNPQSDTLLLACIHLPLLLWVVFGASFVGNEFKNFRKRLEFLRFNGDLLVIMAILILACILMTGITIGLFNLIGLQIEEFYFNYVVIFGLPAVPIVATFLTYTNPQLVYKVSPIIARIFSPLVLVMLIIYLGAIIYSGKDPYNDREFLLLFNLLLIGVMALIFFSVAEISSEEKAVSGKWILFLLSLVTIIVNGIALSAILFRISEWGITPNRLAVLGANILILTNLLLVSFRLFQTVQKKIGIREVGNIIVKYLPVYFIWALIVVFLFPFLFGFK